MIRNGIILFSVNFFLFIYSAFPQSHEFGNYPLIIRGEVIVDMEPIYAGFVDENYPLDISTAGRRALEESAMFFSAMIYGWSFNYEVGEAARQIEEILDLEPVASIVYGDSALRVTDTSVNNNRLTVWADYNLNDSQQGWMRMWSSGTIRSLQAVGYGPSSMDTYPGWLAVRKIALEDAARTALRNVLRSSERNRPKEVTGFISLASFPRYFIDSGRWAVSARFKVQIVEIIPFAVY